MIEYECIAWFGEMGIKVCMLANDEENATYKAKLCASNLFSSAYNVFVDKKHVQITELEKR